MENTWCVIQKPVESVLQTNSKRGSQESQHMKLDTNQRENNTKVGTDETMESGESYDFFLNLLNI